MKGTYDNSNYAFRIVYFYRNDGWSPRKFQHGKQLYEYGYDLKPFSSFDGLTVDEIFKPRQIEEKNRIERNKREGWNNAHVAHVEGVLLFGYSIEENKLVGGEMLAPIFIDEQDLSASTIEYALANKIMKRYPTLNDSSKRKFLAFLERYVVDYAQVKEFVQTGKNILEGVDPLLGISSQGTTRRNR